MTHGWQFEAARALSNALVLMAGLVIFAPAFAAAPAAVDEHPRGDISNPDAEEPAQLAAPESSGDTESAAVPPTSSGTGSGSTPGLLVNKGSAEKYRESKGGASRQGGARDSAAASERTLVVASDPFNGGSTRLMLILLAMVAAMFTGVALWLRRAEGDDANLSSGASGATNVTSETRSL